MSYFVTGATGFIGRYLVGNLLKRSGTVYVLVRKDSQKKFDAIASAPAADKKPAAAKPTPGKPIVKPPKGF